ncbi:MAG: protein-disulfide reductase DsbD [Gemmatimonadetes bacterium]|nr:protein-disulfide reductase DsbD [Gemmatimonadota bacterium]
MVRIRLAWIIFLCFPALLSFATDAGAQASPFSVSLEAARPNTEGVATLRATVEVPSGHYLYQHGMDFFLVDTLDIMLEEVNWPPGKVKFDKFLDAKTEIHEKSPTVEVLVTVQEGASLPDSARAYVLFQGCTDEFCYFPEEVYVAAAWSDELASGGGTASSAGANSGAADGGAAAAGVAAGAGAAAGAAGETGGAAGFDVAAKIASQGLFVTYIAVFLSGILLSFTPCVFPMIPITLSVIGARGEKSPLKGFMLSLVYVFGMALTYAVLGLVAASTGALFGSLFQSPVFVFSIITIFVVLALGMFGLYELQVPSSVAVRLQGVGGSGGFVGIFLMGIVAGLVASPCVGPVLVGLLVYIAQTGNGLLGFTLLFTLAFGIGVIFLALGTFSGLLTALPGAGTWMEGVKQFFGYLLLGVALYYARPFLPEEAFWCGTGALMLLMASTLFGLFDPLHEHAHTTHRIRKAIGVLVGSTGVLFFLAPLAGLFFTFPAAVSGEAGSAGESIVWIDDYDAGYEMARSNGMPMMIDFTAEWCAACKELEHYTYTAPVVVKEAERFVSIQVDCTRSTPNVDRLKEKYSVYGLPTIIWIDSKGDVIEELTVTGFVEADPYAEIMRAVN